MTKTINKTRGFITKETKAFTMDNGEAVYCTPCIACDLDDEWGTYSGYYCVTESGVTFLCVCDLYTRYTGDEESFDEITERCDDCVGCNGAPKTILYGRLHIGFRFN